MTDKELRKLKKTEMLELMIALRNELDRVQAENDALREKLKTAEKSAFHQVETEAVAAVRSLLQVIEAETDTCREKIKATSQTDETKTQ